MEWRNEFRVGIWGDNGCKWRSSSCGLQYNVRQLTDVDMILAVTND